MIITIISIPINIFAYSDYVSASGETIGIEIKNKGIIVSDFYKVEDYYPGKDAGLKKGDIIIKVGNRNVNSVDDFIDEIKNNNEIIDITYVRLGKEYKTKLHLYSKDSIIKTGLYVKDTISGIGTLTYIDPNTKIYGALGHEINDSISNTKIVTNDGNIYASKVTGIEKSIRGEPGSKNASVNSSKIYGNIKENTIYGVFGTYNKDIDKDSLYKVANYSEIKLGNAKIITVVSDNKKEKYDINIIKVNDDKNDNKNILFEITDQNLLKKTGGIVQGMSGSPIIQDNKIIGAVNNVVVNNPSRGYGVLITSMLEEGEN